MAVNLNMCITMEQAVAEEWAVTDELYANTDIKKPISFGTGNCGAGLFSSTLATLAQKLVGVNFDRACYFHDEEWKLDVKSIEHKIEADRNFELNLIRCMEGGVTRNKLRLAAWFHAAVAVNIDHYQES